MAVQHPLDEELNAADFAIRHAQDVRSYHGRRTAKGSPQREKDLEEARERVRQAMKPLRSYLGRNGSRPQTAANEKQITRVQEASKRLQKERRKLWKMQKRNNNGNE